MKRNESISVFVEKSLKDSIREKAAGIEMDISKVTRLLWRGWINEDIFLPQNASKLAINKSGFKKHNIQ